MRKEEADRELDSVLAAILANVAALAITGVLAWFTKAPINSFLKFLDVDYLSPFKFLNAWGTLMATIALLATIADGVVALVADIKGRGNRVQVPRTASRGLRNLLRNREFHRQCIIYCWAGAFGVFGIGYLFHAHIL